MVIDVDQFKLQAMNRPRVNEPLSIEATFKNSPQDFEVSEQLGFEPTAEGEHLLLRIEKRDINTHQMIEYVAQHASVRPRDIGYCGLKDRQAVARQWLSVNVSEPGLIDKLNQHPELKVLTHIRHSHKLRVGSHQANKFKITVRNFDVDESLLRQRLAVISN